MKMNKGIKMIIMGLGIMAVFGHVNAAGKKAGTSKSTVSNKKSGYIGIDRARSIALSRVSGANRSHVVKLYLDYEDGRPVYEGKIYFKGVEYEFDIDAVSGKVISWDVDRD